MKKSIKTILIIIVSILGIIILDSIQALIFDNNPIIKINEYYNGGDLNYKSKGILVDTINCTNGKKDAVLKGFSYSCSYNGGNYTLVDKTKEIEDFTCAEALEEFYEDNNYVYYWNCIKNKYMIVKYDNGKEETISQALLKGHIDIQILDKFDIGYIKEEKDKISLEDINDIINNYFAKDDVDKSNMAYWAVDEKKHVVVVGMMDISVEKQNEFINNVFSSCCGKDYIKYIRENKLIEFKESIDVFEGKIIETKDNSITVKVLKNSKSFKKDDKVTMKITRPTSGVNDFYVVGNDVRITFNGMVETSNPAQIGATKIELIIK